MLVRKGAPRSIYISSVVLVVLLASASAWAWGKDGHEIVAVIAADNLTPAAQSHVASILGVPSNTRSIAAAMKKASFFPDSEKFREENPSTKPWHYINICLQARQMDVQRSCGSEGCVTEKIDEYSQLLKQGKSDKWGDKVDLAFLIHFVGDIHQPLHAANNADFGGNCVAVDSHSPKKDLHSTWDTTIVEGLESSMDSGPDKTARRLEQTYAAEQAGDSWIPGQTGSIAWESNQIAGTEIYAPLRIRIEPCQPTANGCSNVPIELNSSYVKHAEEVAGHQLAKAGFRLASLLNETSTQPVNPNDVTHAASTAPRQVPSSETVTGPIIGNTHSKKYAWRECGTYDTMLPKNRIEFPSRAAAEQQGYVKYKNCP
jgi:hypothetical protein